MASNPYVNKVVLGSDVLLDLTGDTAEAADVAAGKTLHLGTGAPAVGTASYAAAPENNGNATTANGILLGYVDSTSTATDFTATVEGLDALYDGVAVMLHNGIVTSASGFVLNVNGLGDKPVYTNLATGNDITPTNPTRETTIFNINYTLLFVYDSQLVEGGAWICYRGYDSNTNTIGYQLRTNSGNLPMADAAYRYRLYFTSADGSKWVPANTSTSTDATTSRTLNTRAIDPFGPIVYNSTNGTTNSGARPAVATLWQQYALTIGYSYVKSLTAWDSVWLKCQPNADGSAVMKDIVQALPSSKDGYIYILLGLAYSATAMELRAEHPVYWHDGTGIRLWTGAEPSSGGGGSKTTWYGICNTIGSDPAKVVSCDGFTLEVGAIIGVKFTFGNTKVGATGYSITLNVNDTGAKKIALSRGALRGTGFTCETDSVLYFMYDGTDYQYITTVSSNMTPEGGGCWYGTSSTAANTQYKAVTLDAYTRRAGSVVFVRFSDANTYTSGSLGLKVNSSLNDIYVNNAVTSSTNQLVWAAGDTLQFIFNGTGWIYISGSSIQDAASALPIATASTLGGVKVGSGLSIDSSGVLSASGGGSSASGWTNVSYSEVGSFSGSVLTDGHLCVIISEHEGTTDDGSGSIIQDLPLPQDYVYFTASRYRTNIPLVVDTDGILMLADPNESNPEEPFDGFTIIYPVASQ